MDPRVERWRRAVHAAFTLPPIDEAGFQCASTWVPRTCEGFLNMLRRLAENPCSSPKVSATPAAASSCGTEMAELSPQRRPPWDLIRVEGSWHRHLEAHDWFRSQCYGIVPEGQTITDQLHSIKRLRRTDPKSPK